MVILATPELYELAVLAGVGIPKTVFARETADLDDVLEQVGGAPVMWCFGRERHKGVGPPGTRRESGARRLPALVVMSLRTANCMTLLGCTGSWV